MSSSCRGKFDTGRIQSLSNPNLNPTSNFNLNLITIAASAFLEREDHSILSIYARKVNRTIYTLESVFSFGNPVAGAVQQVVFTP